MLDYLDIESEFTAEERQFRDTVRDFLDERVRPNIADHYEAGTFPTEIITEMGDLNLYAPNLDGRGFPGVSETAYGLLMQELEACDSGLRSMASVQGALVIYPIDTYGSAEQKDRLLSDLASGETVGCFALTEPDHGSNPSGMTTTAEVDGDGYVLNGRKRWVTNSPIADIALIWARDRSEPDDPVRGFLVETDREGVEVEEIDGKLSLRVSPSGAIALDDAWVPAENRLPGVSGMKGPLSCLTQARFGIVWGAVGAARDAFEVAREYATDREQFGKPIAGFQLQQEKLAEMATQITLGQLLAVRLARLKERGELRPQQVSMGKRNNVRMAREQTRVAREMLGGNGITTAYSPMRHLANMETVYTYEGTHDIHSLILGEDLTGLSAFE
ncbi:acyl-CoA dehydrogenase family protein [Halovenus marina]|uniref:acyl-CoA dehydrogenase family protein n=1 Tax=Halovenus marina TaxID=3396621 RepID=UPI003F5648C3